MSLVISETESKEMKYVVRRSFVEVVGVLWLPAVTASSQIQLSQHEIDSIRDRVDSGITRENILQWLLLNTGDFRAIVDFSANIEDGDQTLEFPFEKEESELVYADCMYGDEE